MDVINLAGKRILVTGAAGFIGAGLVQRLLRTERPARVVGIDNLNDYYDVHIKEWRLAGIEAAAAACADNAERMDNAACADNAERMYNATYTGNASCTGDLTHAEIEMVSHTGSSRQVSGDDKRSRAEASRKGSSVWRFVKGDISDAETVRRLFEEEKPDIVVNLAAQAGVRYSITNPDAYIKTNLLGFYNLLEACRHASEGCGGNHKGPVAEGEDHKGPPAGTTGSAGAVQQTTASSPYRGVQHFVYASSSSVYGASQKVPFSTEDKVDDPVSLYAATKKSDELLAHAYSKLYDIPMTGLRYFTVYGPAGRPDMAYYGFTDKLRAGKTIRIFNYGNCSRDFTYIDDIVEGTVRVMKGAPSRQTGEDGLPIPPYALYNIGGGQPQNLLDFVDILQQELLRAGVLAPDYDFAAHRELVPMQAGDVPVTYADTEPLQRDFGYRPQTDLRSGLRKFAEWYRDFYQL